MNGDFAKRFHKQSTAAWRQSGLPPKEEWPEEWQKASFKTYPRFPQIPLVAPLPLEKSLDKVLATRKTSRSFAKETFISFEELSTILFLSAGIRTEEKSEERSKRFYPSGGRRYPLELYVSAERVTGLERGIYHYNIKDNTLELLSGKDSCETFKRSLGYPWSRDASAALLITSVWDRTLDKYRDFGYRFAGIEAGHLSQNLQLTSEALGLSYASVAGINEEQLDQLLEFDPHTENSLYLTVIGRVKETTPEKPSRP